MFCQLCRPRRLASGRRSRISIPSLAQPAVLDAITSAGSRRGETVVISAARALQPIGDRPARLRRRSDHRAVARRLVAKDALLGRDIAGQIAVPVEMIGREVEPDGDPAAQRCRTGRAGRRTARARTRRVARPGSSSNTGRPILPPSTASTPAATQQMMDQGRGGRFAVGAGDADDRPAHPTTRRTGRRRRGSGRPAARAAAITADAAAGWVSGTPGLGTRSARPRNVGRPSRRG